VVILSAAKDLATAVFAVVTSFFLTRPEGNHAAKECRMISFTPQTPFRMTDKLVKLFTGHHTSA